LNPQAEIAEYRVHEELKWTRVHDGREQTGGADEASTAQRGIQGRSDQGMFTAGSVDSGYLYQKLRAHPGEVMGLFAYVHPFLDGNGRTMLIVHAELCQRAGFSILWQNTSKDDYLTALTEEIRLPGKGVLDRYLLRFKGPAQVSGAWIATVATLHGLDGIGTQDEVGGSFSDPAVVAQYQQFERHRGYEIKD
jgi:hypothetical protein